MDLPGIVLFAATLLALLLLLMDPGRWWLAPVVLGAGTGFVVRELRTAAPFLDLRVFGGNAPLLMTFARALPAAVVSYAFLYGFTSGWRRVGGCRRRPPEWCCCRCSGSGSRSPRSPAGARRSAANW